MTATFTTLDPLNAAHNPRHELQTLILAEVFLAGGPCDIYRLWSEMFDRQRSINVGTVLFIREIVEMEDQGLLEQREINKTAITKQGEVHLFGLMLLGLIPDGSLKRLESKGLKLASTQNILDVAKSGESPFDSGLGSGSTLQAGDAGSNPAAELSGEAWTNGRSPAVIDVADVSPVPALAQGGEIKPSCSSPLYLLASEIVDIVERAEQERLESVEAEREGVMTQMSGYQDAGMRGV